jgi:4-hydroxyacetophenone monooxygenase
MDAQARECLATASVPLLLMCLAQITGEARWLQPPFSPQRDRRLFHDESGGLPQEVQEQVRRAMADVLDQLHRGERRLPCGVEEAQLAEMMRVCVAEEVPPEYVPMAMEELGFRDRDVHWEDEVCRHRAKQRHVLVVGAGMSGICAAVKLRALGFRCTVVERNAQSGGVWVENNYPEAGVDTPNQFYSYSFAPRADWSSYFSKREEVLRYFQDVAAAKGAGDEIRLSTTVERLAWDEARHQWRATLRGPEARVEELVADFVVSAVGQMNQPKMPALPGADGYRGAAFHSARWRHDVDLRGKRVVVVGAGASAMQLVPSVAEQASHMTLIQRSPQWVLPVDDYRRKVTRETQWLLANVPYYLAWYRFSLFWRFSDAVLKTLRREAAWPHQDRSVSAANDRNRKMMTDYLTGKLEGRLDLVEQLLPHYPPYGKRILIDNRWFETLRRPNVRVVTSGVERFQPEGIVDQSGELHAADVVVFATGFHAGRMLHTVDVRGRGGVALAEIWGEDDPRAYLGITVPGFPNFFCMYGPNSNLGHGGSAIFQAECQIRYITGCLKRMLEKGISALEVRRDVHDAYNERVDAEHAKLVWSHPGTTNWFRNSRGRVFSIMPWRMVDYWQMTHDPDLADYLCLKEDGR